MGVTIVRCAIARCPQLLNGEICALHKGQPVCNEHATVGMERVATFWKKDNALDYWDGPNTQLFGTYCKGPKQAKMTLQMVEATTGIKQALLIKK